MPSIHVAPFYNNNKKFDYKSDHLVVCFVNIFTVFARARITLVDLTFAAIFFSFENENVEVNQKKKTGATHQTYSNPVKPGTQ